MRIAVFGLGYVGSVTAAALAREGHDVHGCDVSTAKIEAMRAGRAPVLEPGLDELVARGMREGRLRVTTAAAEAMAGAEISLIAVGTPSAADGSIDLGAVRNVARQIGSLLPRAAPQHLVTVRSTVLPGTTRNVLVPEVERACGRPAGDGWDVAVNPEFLREGCSLEDYDRPVRILVGERVPGAGQRILDLYARAEAPAYRTPLEVAEAVKYADNSFHALKIAFANEVARVCEALGVDAARVLEIFAADRKLNSSAAYLRPGFAFGGSCLPKDLRALTFAARQASVPAPVLDSILPSNELQIRRAADRVLATGKRRVLLLGLSFKAGTDDLRESPLVELAERLIGKGLDLAIYDPAVSIARVHGSNRAYLEQHLPHVHRLLIEDLQAGLRASDVVVVGHLDPSLDQADAWRAEGKAVLRLA